MAEFEDALKIMRTGGVDGPFLFLKYAKEFFDRGGTSGLTGWVALAFRELPEEAQISTLCVALEAKIKQMK